MRIAIVTSLVGGNGEDFAVLDQCELLQQAGHEVSLITRSTPQLRDSPGYAARAAVTVATGHGPNPMTQIEEFEPDIVHVHNTYPNYGRSWVRDLQVPLVVTLHSFRFFCARATLIRDSQICTDCMTSPMAATRHGCYEGRARSLPYSIAGLRRRTDPLLNRADRIIVLNPRLGDYLREAGFDPAKIRQGSNTVIPRAAVDDTDEPERPWLFVGRLTQEKGILRLLQRWPADEPLDIIGDGPVMEQVQAMKGPRVRILGMQDRETTARAMSGARGLIIPSICSKACRWSISRPCRRGCP